MCNCFCSAFIPHSCGVWTSRLGFNVTCKYNPKTLPIHGILGLHRNSRLGNCKIHFASDCFKPQRAKKNIPNSSNSTQAKLRNSSIFSSDDGYEFSEIETEIPSPSKGFGEEDNDSGVGFLEFNSEKGREEEEIRKTGAVSVDNDTKLGHLERRIVMKMMKRSNMIAKQVISIRSALSFGFVSQLWVDINSWTVSLIEVKPNLLSGEVEKFLLEDVKQVGDVVLVEDENVMENEFKLVGLETLVGYNVVTPSQRNIGKVRGYTFNINSGAVESLELDSLGISVIPSSLVSTYCLFVEDVLDVLSDTIVVHEAAASRLQRLTKGFWDAQKTGYSADEIEDYRELRTRRAEQAQDRSRRRKSLGKKLRKKMKEHIDDWELPMDFF